MFLPLVLLFVVASRLWPTSARPIGPILVGPLRFWPTLPTRLGLTALRRLPRDRPKFHAFFSFYLLFSFFFSLSGCLLVSFFLFGVSLVEFWWYFGSVVTSNVLVFALKIVVWKPPTACKPPSPPFITLENAPLIVAKVGETMAKTGRGQSRSRPKTHPGHFRPSKLLHYFCCFFVSFFAAV